MTYIVFFLTFSSLFAPSILLYYFFAFFHFALLLSSLLSVCVRLLVSLESVSNCNI